MTMTNPFAQALSAALHYAIISRDVSDNTLLIGFAYREAAAFEQDSGWRFFSGEESDAFCDDAANFDTLPLNEILATHPEIKVLMDKGEGAWEWNEDLNDFTPVADWQPQDES